jgi:hypothetical protein
MHTPAPLRPPPEHAFIHPEVGTGVEALGGTLGGSWAAQKGIDGGGDTSSRGALVGDNVADGAWGGYPTTSLGY